ncbi:S1C family serine protease [Streptomyces sp. NPDC058045]|uniref:S1C family serine protease n=1 Tax=Streptomyces sp. NPDC058045 TaxID=3346311 RepID=UPI0036EEE3BE
MTESFRRSGDQDPQHSAPGYSGRPTPAEPGAYSGHGGFPPPAAYEPGFGPQGHGDGPGGSGRRGRRRARGPMALLASVAIVAGAIGGGTAYAFQQLNDGGQDTAAATVPGTAVAASSKGTVAGVAAAVSPSIVEISAASGGGQSTGSGVIVTSDGEIVTNNHVVAGASQIKVTLDGGRRYTAKVVGTDPKKDLALIKLHGASGLKAASLGDSGRLAVGEQVVAIGSPEGLSGTVTSGIVSALHRDVTVPVDQQQGSQGGQGGGQWPFEYGGRQFNGDPGSSTTTYKAIQTDASLNPGNSGGALINMSGQIVGINSAMYAPSSSSSASSSGAGSVGLGFAIPINTVKADLDQLRGN